MFLSFFSRQGVRELPEVRRAVPGPLLYSSCCKRRSQEVWAAQPQCTPEHPWGAGLAPEYWHPF